jgi:translation initiation factor 1
MKNNDWKDRLGMVYSTNPDFKYDTGEEAESETLPPQKQKLRVTLDKKNRKGKVVTLISGYTGTEADLDELARQLKTKLGTGGSAKDGEILIQGDVRNKAMELLRGWGYGVK